MDSRQINAIKILHILREEYPLFRAGLPADRRLPPNYDDWLKEAVRTHRTHRAAGFDTERVVIQWDDFVSYTNRMRIKQSYAALNAFASLKSKLEKRTGPARV